MDNVESLRWVHVFRSVQPAVAMLVPTPNKQFSIFCNSQPVLVTRADFGNFGIDFDQICLTFGLTLPPKLSVAVSATAGHQPILLQAQGVGPSTADLSDRLF